MSYVSLVFHILFRVEMAAIAIYIYIYICSNVHLHHTSEPMMEDDPRLAIPLSIIQANTIYWKTTVPEFLLNWNRDQLIHCMLTKIEKIYFYDVEKEWVRMSNNCYFTLLLGIGRTYDEEKQLFIYFAVLSTCISQINHLTQSSTCDIFVSQDPHLFIMYIVKSRQLRHIIQKGEIDQCEIIKESIEKEHGIIVDHDIMPASLQHFCMETIYENKVNYENIPITIKRYLDKFIQMKRMNFDYIYMAR